MNQGPSGAIRSILREKSRSLIRTVSVPDIKVGGEEENYLRSSRGSLSSLTPSLITDFDVKDLEEDVFTPTCPTKEMIEKTEEVQIKKRITFAEK